MLKNWLQILVFYLFLLILVLGGGITLYSVLKTNEHTKVLASCTMHLPGHMHTHVMLRILFLGQPYLIPANTGIDNGCMHPVHTHDTSGMLHIDYYQPYQFILRDFFTDWGIIYTKEQLGSILLGSRYKITQLVNGKVNTEYEYYVLHDQDRVELRITKQ